MTLLDAQIAAWATPLLSHKCPTSMADLLLCLALNLKQAVTVSLVARLRSR